MTRRTRGATALALTLAVNAAWAGPYAALAQDVQSNGGVLRMYADATLQAADAPTQNAAAVSACHAVAGEGVAVISVQIIGSDNQTVIRTIGQDVIAGC